MRGPMSMKSFRKHRQNVFAYTSCLVVLGLVMVLPPAAPAQTSGTVAISGAVTAAVKLTSGGAATITGTISGGGVTAQSASDAALATVVDFGDVGPGNTNSAVCFTQPLFLRSNAGASLKGAMTASTGFGVGTGDIKASDVGIGFTGLSTGGNPNADISTATVTAAYSSDPCAGTLNPLGIPSFAATNSLATLAPAPGTIVMSSTGPLSLRGAFASASNRVLLNMKLAILPQAYTVTAGFTATVTLTMTSP